jgi:hypothetical protein
MGNEPNPDEIPVEIDDLPEELQTIFDLYTKLPDRWDTFNGVYQGKDLTCLGVILDIKKVEDRATALDLILMIDAAREHQLAKKRKQAEQRKKK